MNGELGLRCCYEGCTNDGVVHLFVGAVKASVDEEATYCGASYCCWAHLAGDTKRLHPDAGGDPGLFRKLNDARDLLDRTAS